MRLTRLWVFVLALGICTPVAAADHDDVAEAVKLLSRYPTGSVPVEDVTLNAVALLGANGTKGDVSLLANLVDHERPEIARAAKDAIRSVRERQVSGQRAQFATDLAAQPTTASKTPAKSSKTFGPKSSECAAYSDALVSTPVAPPPVGLRGDPRELLAEGKPLLALAAVADEPAQEAQLLEARALEELGDVKGAVATYAELAVDGNGEAREALAHYGVDAERLLLGMLLKPENSLNANDAKVLSVLIRSGSGLTVEVLAERTLSPLQSDQLVAADALVQMLDGSGRSTPLSAASSKRARGALRALLKGTHAAVRALAAEALRSR